jgi:hypothetical protein
MLLVSGVSMRGARCGDESKWELSGGQVWPPGQISMAGRAPSPSFPFFPFYYIPLYLNHRTLGTNWRAFGHMSWPPGHLPWLLYIRATKGSLVLHPISSQA